MTPGLCWGQVLPSQTSPLLNKQNEHTDVFGRPIITDSVFNGYYNQFNAGIPIDFEDIKGFQLLFGLKEEYNTNLNLTRDNRKDDFITSVSSGLRYNKQEPAAGLDLMYALGYSIYAKNSDLDFLGHLAGLRSYYKPKSNFTLSFRDVLIRNDDPLQFDPSNPGQYYLSTAASRNTYIRNIAEPQIQYRFGPDNHLGLLYRNNYFNVDDRDDSDGTEHAINPRLLYWFDIRNGVLIDYSYTRTEMKESSDWTGNDVRSRYTYRFSPITSVFGEFYFGNRLFDPPSVNYNIYSPSIGIEHAFSPNLLALVRAGYLEMRPKSGETHDSPVLNLGITKRTELSTYSLMIESGFREDYLSPENLGYAEYKRVEAAFSHRILSRLAMSISASAERAEFTINDIEEDIYTLSARLSWNPFKGLFIAPALFYRNVDSTTNDYWVFRGYLTATLTH